MPGTTINQNYVKGIPPATSGPTYGLHNDEGSAYITENDNVLDIDPGVKYTINCEDFGGKHDLTILRTYATVNKMGVEPAQQHDRSAGRRRRQRVAGDPVRHLPELGRPGRVPEPSCRARSSSTQDYVLPGELSRSRAGTSQPRHPKQRQRVERGLVRARRERRSSSAGATMTKAAGDATSIAVPDARAGTYKLHVVDAQGNKLGESAALLRVN